MDDPQFQQKGFAKLTSYHVANEDVAPSHMLHPPQGAFPKTFVTSYGMLFWERGEDSFHGAVPECGLWLGEGEKRDRCEDLVGRVRACGAKNANSLAESMMCQMNAMCKYFFLN